jgi:hypothetical protein
MRGMLFAMAALGTGGVALFAGSPGPDFDEVVNKPPMTVYAAFSALGQEGSLTEPPNDSFNHRVTRRIAKEHGRSLSYEILFDDRPVLDVDLNFEPGPDGNGTRLTAEFDIDAYELGSAFETEAGVQLSMMPTGFLDLQFANFMGEMVEDIEAGRPLPPLGLADSGVQWRSNPEASLAGRRRQAEQSRRQASAPASRAEPMVDPNDVARSHVRSGGDPNAGRPESGR